MFGTDCQRCKSCAYPDREIEVVTVDSELTIALDLALDY